MKKMKLLLLFFPLLAGVYLTSCNPVQEDPLSLWNDTSIKAKIIQFVQKDAPQIPKRDRIAVFDMDGTIACEAPLWFEMYSAVQGLNMQVQKDSALLKIPMYRYASELNKNPDDSAVFKVWGPSIQPMIANAYKGWSNEDYIRFTRNYMDTAMNRTYHVPLIKTFYPPMLQLISYLKKNGFDVYIVSGSLQGLIWSVAPQATGFDRSHLIGTRQAMTPEYVYGKETKFILKPEIFTPSNNGDGKAIDIYTQLGKTPVFAFGNTTGDWGMFRMTSTNTLPNICFMLNHDDGAREYVYKPWHGRGMPGWQDTMAVHHWNIVSMKKNFKVVFEKK
ncbi:MAG: haloacid dehalogenase-like hydrolase [Bacteroidales bacterium]|nr:haloacid dehalogenase-like hydrolase [Bacteroidales bacterium]